MAHDLDLNALARFAAVIEHGGFSPAARALALPRQSVHRSVVKLEEDVTDTWDVGSISNVNVSNLVITDREGARGSSV